MGINSQYFLRISCSLPVIKFCLSAHKDTDKTDRQTRTQRTHLLEFAINNAKLDRGCCYFQWESPVAKRPLAPLSLTESQLPPFPVGSLIGQPLYAGANVWEAIDHRTGTPTLPAFGQSRLSPPPWCQPFVKYAENGGNCTAPWLWAVQLWTVQRTVWFACSQKVSNTFVNFFVKKSKKDRFLTSFSLHKMLCYCGRWQRSVRTLQPLADKLAGEEPRAQMAAWLLAG